MKRKFNNCQKKTRVVLIGMSPPPIGGVSIHFSRLLNFLLSRPELEISVIEAKIYNSVPLMRELLMYRSGVIHLHVSSPVIRFIFAVLAVAFHRKLIITYHGNLGRFRPIKNTFDYASIYLCSIPLVLNEGSLVVAKKFNSRAKLVSAYIHPQTVQELPEDTVATLMAFKAEFDYVFCTCAFRYTKDRLGQETYGVTELVQLFSSLQRFGLILSDPSGEYAEFLRLCFQPLPRNLLVVTGNHAFFEIIKNSDGFLRHTTTDGDSLSVRESLSLQKAVFATDVVSRPSQVVVYDNIATLRELLQKFKSNSENNVTCEDAPDSLEIHVEIYKTLGWCGPSFYDT